MEFESQELSRTVECELHPNLRISAVRDASGKMLDFDRDNANQLLVRVALPDSIAPGQKTKLTFEYAGPLANEENSPVPGVRLASINKDGAYLLLPARWFPVTGYPGNRYTGIFHMEVPQDFAVVGTGNAEAPAPVTSTPLISVTSTSTSASGAPVLRSRNSPAASASAPASVKSDTAPAPAPASPPITSRIAYTFRVERPEAAGTFVAGSLQLYPVQAEGVNVSVYARPGDSGTAQSYGGAVARIVNAFSDQFGPLPQPNLTVAQMPDGTLPSYAAPGLLLISQRQWAANPNSRLLSNLVAEQWWGNQVLPASPSDVWLSDGLARYSEALYVEQTAGKEGMNKALDDCAIGALMYEESSPIAEAGRLIPFTPNYASIVVNKGAMVFHMLREQLGDDAFFALLRDFYKQFAGKAASLDNFEKMAEDRADKLAPAPGTFALGNASPAGTAAPSAAPSSPGSAGPVNLRPFFAQWINSTGVPEFNITYTIFRTKAGFRLSGRVKQNLDFFNMPVEIEVLTEGNPEFKTVQVSGTDSSFDFEVFGRPRPNGIILDPSNYILKSSPALRVRAIIARGEALAEQGRYYDAIQQYSQALDQQRNNALAEFRMGEAFFYQKNYSAAANAFRDALDGDIDPSFKWVEVWAHLYLGKIYDIAGDRARAVNEYSKAEQTNDDTGGAQAEAKKYLAQPYKEGA